MDNFKFGVFDIFSATIPGIPLTILFSFLIKKEPFHVDTITIALTDLNLASTIFLFIVSYVLGFSIQYISYEFFKLIVEKTKIWKKRIGEFPTSIGKRGEELSMIREFSKENYNILNIFMALRALSYNLSFTLIIFFWGILSLTMTVGEFDFEIVFILFISLALSISLFRRAISFHEWSHKLIRDSRETIEFLKSNIIKPSI